MRKDRQFAQGEKHAINISIVGAGATGVVLAAELRHASRELPVYGMKHQNPSDVTINVIEAAGRILPALPERLSNAATRELNRQHIQVLTGQLVSMVQDGSVTLKDRSELLSDMTIWAAGIKAPAFLAELDGL